MFFVINDDVVVGNVAFLVRTRFLGVELCLLGWK